MLAYGGLGLIIGPREGELSLNCCFELSWIWFAAHSLQYVTCRIDVVNFIAQEAVVKYNKAVVNYSHGMTTVTIKRKIF